MATLGNRSDLFLDSDYVEKRQNGYTGYDIPPEALADGAFAAVTMEAEKYWAKARPPRKGRLYINGKRGLRISGVLCASLNINASKLITIRLVYEKSISKREASS